MSQEHTQSPRPTHRQVPLGKVDTRVYHHHRCGTPPYPSVTGREKRHATHRGLKLKLVRGGRRTTQNPELIHA